jgi:hypothetical protein
LDSRASDSIAGASSSWIFSPSAPARAKYLVVVVVVVVVVRGSPAVSI